VTFPVHALTLSRCWASFVWQIALARHRQSHRHRAGTQ
jgi:hypothetical protein